MKAIEGNEGNKEESRHQGEQKKTRKFTKNDVEIKDKRVETTITSVERKRVGEEEMSQEEVPFLTPEVGVRLRLFQKLAGWILDCLGTPPSPRRGGGEKNMRTNGAKPLRACSRSASSQSGFRPATWTVKARPRAANCASADAWRWPVEKNTQNEPRA